MHFTVFKLHFNKIDWNVSVVTSSKRFNFNSIYHSCDFYIIVIMYLEDSLEALELQGDQTSQS